MIRICAWCRQEGKPGILGASPGEPTKINEPESHGICQDHGISLRQTFERDLLDPHIQPTPLPSSLVSFRT
jgi:hypothetical protein